MPTVLRPVRRRSPLAGGPFPATGSGSGTASGGFTLSGSAPPVPGLVGTGGLVLSGSSAPTPAAVGTGGLTLGGTAIVGVGALGTGGLVLSGYAGTSSVLVASASGGLTLSGVAIVGVGALGTGGLTLSGSSRPVPGALGTGGLTLAGTAIVAQPGGGTQVATAAGGLVLSGTSVVSVGVFGAGSLTLSGVATVVSGGSSPPPGPPSTGHGNAPPEVDDGDFPVPDDLVDAVVARLQERLVAAGALTWAGLDLAGPGQALPYVVVHEPDEDDSYWDAEGDGLADGHLILACYGDSKKQAKGAGKLVFRALQDAPLEFAEGSLVYLRQAGRPSVALDPDPAPGGGDCWQEARSFRFMYSFDPPGPTS